MRRILIGFLILLLAPPAFSQGPWPEGDDQGYFRLRFSSLHYDRLLDGFNEPDIGLKREVTHLTWQAFFEYGLTDRLDVHISVPFKILGTSDELLNPKNDNYPLDTVESGSMHAFSNIELGAKYLIASGTFNIAGKLRLGANTVMYDSITGLRSGYDAWMITPSISIGKELKRFYYFTEGGYRIKTNNYSNDFLARIEGGFRVDWQQNTSTWFVLFVKADFPSSVGFYEDNRSLHTGLYVDGEGFISPGLRVSQQLSGFLWVDLGLSYPVWGEDHAKAPSLFVSAVWDW